MNSKERKRFDDYHSKVEEHDKTLWASLGIGNFPRWKGISILCIMAMSATAALHATFGEGFRCYDPGPNGTFMDEQWKSDVGKMVDTLDPQMLMFHIPYKSRHTPVVEDAWMSDLMLQQLSRGRAVLHLDETQRRWKGTALESLNKENDSLSGQMFKRLKCKGALTVRTNSSHVMEALKELSLIHI